MQPAVLGVGELVPFRWCLVCVVLLLGPVANGPAKGQYLSSPCPKIFSYRFDPNTSEPFGYVELHNLRIGQLVKLNVDLSIGVPVPKSNVGSITLVKSRPQTFLDIFNNRPAQYRVNFPFTNIYPSVLAISVNGQAICTGQKVKGPIVTTINLEHTLFTQVQQLNSNGNTVAGNANGIPYQPAVHQIVSQRSGQQTNDTPTAIVFQPPETAVTTQRSLLFPRVLAPQPQPQQTVYRPPPAATTRSASSDISCGTVAPLGSRLSINGIRSSKGQFPWAAPIFNTAGVSKPQYICGSSLITATHVLTAAHCMYFPVGTERQADQLSVVPGMYNIDNFFDSSNQERDVAKIFIHDDYFFEDAELTDSDISVLALTHPVVYDDLVRPICLWSESDNLEQIIGAKGFISSWGVTESGGDATYPSYVTATVIDKRDCSRQLGRLVPPSSRTFCGAGYGAVPCNGDSGSGLALKRGSRYYLRGIVSTGQLDINTQLCDSKKYVIYTDVAPFRYWLSRIVKK
ncbi:serine protease gd-like [Anopheles bellator]|uniref:serine protease gd-like n=1 Tax=Anopheles bellator TaxID=139047 RepID=UPI002647A5B9|nr:serine protease gd-like [Anopheles bellator]